MGGNIFIAIQCIILIDRSKMYEYNGTQRTVKRHDIRHEQLYTEHSCFIISYIKHTKMLK